MHPPKQISFEDYVQAYVASRRGSYFSDSAREPQATVEVPTTESQFQAISEAFQAEYGEIINQYICSDGHTAVMLTQKKPKNPFASGFSHFFTQYELGKQSDMEKILIKIDFLAAECARTLRGQELTKCLGLIYKIAKNTLGLLDASRHSASEEAEANFAETVKVIRGNLDQARAYHDKTAKFTAQSEYFKGNIIGFFGLAVLVILLSACTNTGLEIPLKPSLACLLFYGILGGGVGAIISVMNRISTGNLMLSTEPGTDTIRTTGLIRPLIGGVFGALLLLLFNSGLSVFELSADNSTKVLANFIVLSFIAGFFERFVPDMLDQQKNKFLQSS